MGSENVMKYNDEAVEKLIDKLVFNNFCVLDIEQLNSKRTCDFQCEDCWKQALGDKPSS